MTRLVKPQPRLPREVGDAPSLETSQARLDGALSSLIQLKMSLLTAGGWARWPLKVPPNSNHSMIPRFFLISHLNLPSLSLKPSPLVLSLQALAKSPSPALSQAPSGLTGEMLQTLQIFMAFCWTCSTNSTSFCCWKPSTGHSTPGSASPVLRSREGSPRPAATLSLTQPGHRAHLRHGGTQQAPLHSGVHQDPQDLLCEAPFQRADPLSVPGVPGVTLPFASLCVELHEAPLCPCSHLVHQPLFPVFTQPLHPVSSS